MTTAQAKETLDKIIGQIFGFQNPFTLDQFLQKYAFDVRLPSKVADSTTGEETWAQSINPTKFVTQKNQLKKDWQLPAKPVHNIQDILQAWNEVNYTTTERMINSVNASQCDNIYDSENVYRSQDVHLSKNVLFSDGARKSEFVAASQRSNGSTFCARIEDSTECSESFAISWSGKITKSMFIHDSYDLFECLFCSHVSGKRFMVANMQYDEAEYRKIKELVVKWVLAS